MEGAGEMAQQVCLPEFSLQNKGEEESGPL